MQHKNREVLNNIVFRTTSFDRNEPLIYNNDNILTEGSGTITHVDFSAREHSNILVGEFEYTIWNLNYSRELNVNAIPLIKEHVRIGQEQYNQIQNLNENEILNFNMINKLIIIHSFILNKKYKKLSIPEEFTEFLYKKYFQKNNKILIYSKPIQDNPIDLDYYCNEKKIINNKKHYSGRSYFDLDNLINEKDSEMNKYKVYSVASRCGFKRLGESDIFELKPTIIKNKINNKVQLIKII